MNVFSFQSADESEHPRESAKRRRRPGGGDELVERSTLTRYLRWLEETRDVHFDDYHALWRWSTTEIEEFWRTIGEHFEVIADGSSDEVLTERVMPGANWFPGIRLNYAEQSSAARPTTRSPSLGDQSPGGLYGVL